MAGGNLRCFTKVRCLSEASSDFCKTLLAEFRQPRSQPPTKPQPEPMHTPRLAIQGGRDRVAARELDEPSALRWTAGGKG